MKRRKHLCKGMIKVLSLCLVAVLCFASLPVLPANAAVQKPKGLKITIKKKSSSKVSVKCSWKSNAAGHYQFILQYSAPDSSSPGMVRGEGAKMTSHTSKIEVEEGIPYTFVLQVRSYNRKGQTSTIAKKTKSYVLVGSATKKVQKIIKQNITGGMTDFEKVRFVHDWIVKKYVYDSLTSVRTFHEAIAGKKAVCQGYALTFLAFMKQMGIPCYFVVSSNGAHSWNIVKVDGRWYHIDVTNDDPKSYESTTKNHPIYTFFLQSTANFQKKVNATGNHQYDTSKYPACTSTKYDNPACTSGYEEQIPDGGLWRSDQTFSPWVNGKMLEGNG